MSHLYVSSPRPRPADVANSPIRGAARQTYALRYRSIVCQPARRNRLQFPCSPGQNTPQNAEHVTCNPATSYTSREETSAETQARREDEEHGATQLILLLTLSVVLLTLPWVVDHPVTLLVPVALFILPITSDALRSLVLEGFALISGGVRWFWRHRKSGHAYTAMQAAGALGPQHVAKPQPTAPHAFVMRGQPPNAWQSCGASVASSQYTCQVSKPQVPNATQQAGTMQGISARINGVPKNFAWQSMSPSPHPVAQPAVVASQSVTVLPELITPDLDFDSDSDTEEPRQKVHQGCPNGSLSYRQGHFAPQSLQAELVPLQHSSTQSIGSQRLQSDVRSTEQTECTVYNWDEADECTQRRGHRPLSDLLNNVQ